jgi:hypothetical protein
MTGRAGGKPWRPFLPLRNQQQSDLHEMLKRVGFLAKPVSFPASYLMMSSLGTSFYEVCYDG